MSELVMEKYVSGYEDYCKKERVSKNLRIILIIYTDLRRLID